MPSAARWVVQVQSGSVRYANGLQPGDSSFSETLNALRERHGALGLAKPVGAAAAALVVLALVLKWPAAVIALLVVAGAAATYFANDHDAARRSAVIAYELDVNVRDAWARVLKGGKALASCTAVWKETPAATACDTVRSPVTVSFAAPPFVKTNVESFAIAWAGRTMHFFPDRVLVYEGDNARAISYRQLDAASRTVLVPEENTPPDDAKIVGRRWRYVTADGQRDTNHPVNRELPLVEYGELEFRGPGGLHEKLHCSRLGSVHELAHTLRTLASLVPDSA